MLTAALIWLVLAVLVGLLVGAAARRGETE